MALPDLDRSRKRYAAAFFDKRAAVGEGAAGGKVGKLGHRAGDGLQPGPLPRAKPGPRAKQAFN